MTLQVDGHDLPDAKEKQISGILSKVLIASGLTYLVVFLCGLYAKDLKMVWVTAIGGLILLIPFALLRRRKLGAGSLILFVSMLGTLTLLATYGQGCRDVALCAFPAILVFTRITLSRAVFITSVFLMVSAVCWLVFGQTYGWFVPLPITSGSFWMDFILLMLILFASAFVVDLLVTAMRRNLDRAEKEVFRRERTEEVLKHTEDKFAKLFNLSPSASGLSDLEDDSYVEVNDTFCALLGYEKHEVIGKTAHALGIILPEAKKAILRHAGTDGRLMNVRADLKAKNGDVKHVLLSAENLEMQGKKYRFTVVHDITDHLKTAEALQESEERYRHLFDASPDGIVLIVADGTIAQANLAQARMYRYDSPEELIGVHATQLVAPSFRHYSSQIMERRLNGEDVSRVEYELIRKDGTTFYGETSATGLRNAQGKVTGYICITRDTTERRKSLDRLRESEEHFRTIFEGTSLAINITRGTEILYANPSYLKRFGYENLETLKKLAPLELFAPECRPKILENIERRAKGLPVPDCYESECMQKDGTRFPILMYFSRGNFQDGTATVGFFLDITDYKLMEKELHKVQKLEALGILAGGIAHDFNNILSLIFGYVEIAARKSREEQISGYLKKALSAMDRARGLTGQLLTFSKGGVPARKIGPLFPFVQETARFALSGSNVVCQFEIAPGLPMANFDQNQIGQVIDNIVINAKQAMPMGGTLELAAKEVRLAEKAHPGLTAGPYVRISIKDTGTGIPREMLARIFDPFFTTKTQGHGLGLATCYSILKRHDGGIDVESELGKGSTFHIYLPAADGVAASTRLNLAPPTKRSGTFILVDDEEGVLEIGREMLESMGYTVVCKPDGREAVALVAGEAAAGRSIAGIILDLTIPGGMGGREAVTEIRKWYPQTPVFVASGYSEDSVMANPREYGFTASICKPFGMDELAEMVGKHLI